jgi:hypothetical protein
MTPRSRDPFSTLRERPGRVSEALPVHGQAQTNRGWCAALRCLQAAAQNKPDQFRSSLEECLEIHKRSARGDLATLGTLIDVLAHGLYGIARRADANVVATFDVTCRR